MFVLNGLLNWLFRGNSWKKGWSGHGLSMEFSHMSTASGGFNLVQRRSECGVVVNHSSDSVNVLVAESSLLHEFKIELNKLSLDNKVAVVVVSGDWVVVGGSKHSHTDSEDFFTLSVSLS